MTNKTDQLVVFKVKTTAPKKYSVRPTHGVILPFKECTINIVLQPSDYETLAIKNKHKFLVLAAYGPKDKGGIPDNFSAENFWKTIKDDVKVYDHKFKCLFDFDDTKESDFLPGEVPFGTFRSSSNSSKSVMRSCPKSRSPGLLATPNAPAAPMQAHADTHAQTAQGHGVSVGTLSLLGGVALAVAYFAFAGAGKDEEKHA